MRLAEYSARIDRRGRPLKISIRWVTSVRTVSTNAPGRLFGGTAGRDHQGFDALAGKRISGR
jgi:hypothetical protein